MHKIITIMVFIVVVFVLLSLWGCPAVPTSGDAIDVYNTKLFAFYGVLVTALINIAGLVIGFRAVNKKAEERTKETREVIQNTKAEITDATGEQVDEARAAIRDIEKKLSDTQVMLATATQRKVRASDLHPSREPLKPGDLPS